jgi:phosphoribosylanthranilate isomerase
VGLNFHKDSPRKVSPDLAARIAKKVPSFVPTVGVFVEQTAAEIVKIAKKVGLAGVQLHGDHTVADCETIASELEVFLIKAVRVGTEADVEVLAALKTRSIIFCWMPGWTANGRHGPNVSLGTGGAGESV